MEADLSKVAVSIYQKAKKGNYYCGDSYYYKETDKEFVCALADGLGSGELARDSSQAVMDVIEKYPDLSIESIIKKCNDALLGKRGVVLGILKIDFHQNTYSYSSIGNIGVITIDREGHRSRNIPLAGYLAGYPRKLRVSRGKAEEGMVFLMFSDGVQDRKLSAKHTSTRNVKLITEQYKEFYGHSRDDDTTLIALKYK
ncbi:phosphoserine phosphatase RsbX [Halobacillus andaensis]|uniref:Phosphoserine phosphatase RsbX n=1 Tax=Halobacillus andaensis TaxID=1176239 RepID=A0A917B9M8_HALAA|nr:SpoIIE family protein phosphatase [Halobacillus andaensis]MBP2006184.1 negative regulator of sigma-B (phosphoserine phosphatase) [Halobacillus andaensis]GGF33112.1 phosphoserine phosphatase RsbX [Halobacillus andaensis]